MRKLKHHERKLLRKVNFFNWKPDDLREVEVVRRYHVQRREEYSHYNKLCGYITRLVALLKRLKPNDPFRIEMTEHLLEKLYSHALIPVKKSLASIEKLAVSAFCRRRLPVVMTRLRMAQTVREAAQLVEQGHIRVGPTLITDPAFHVTRSLEDFVTWTDQSSIKRTVLKYNDKLDDYDLLGQ
mmetsp:Transcript_24802/g.43679  ORF Transcript_24802/g.43679 Transcript_24802/m.43679 type:complete len:183 (+) Transcript_24802:489-1037(+)